MDRLVNTALTAMRAAMSRQSTIANNLANTNTVGFRAEIANATTRWIDGQTFKTRAQTSEQVLGADMKKAPSHRRAILSTSRSMAKRCWPFRPMTAAKPIRGAAT